MKLVNDLLNYEFIETPMETLLLHNVIYTKEHGEGFWVYDGENVVKDSVGSKIIFASTVPPDNSVHRLVITNSKYSEIDVKEGIILGLMLGLNKTENVTKEDIKKDIRLLLDKGFYLKTDLTYRFIGTELDSLEYKSLYNSMKPKPGVIYSKSFSRFCDVDTTVETFSKIYPNHWEEVEVPLVENKGIIYGEWI